MVGSLACRGSAAQVALDTVISYSTNGDSAALHLEIFLTRDTVAHGLGDVQRKIFHGDVVAALDGVLRVANDIQRAVALQLDLPLAVDAGLLRAIGSVGQRVHGILLRAELNALTVGDVDSGAAGVSQRQPGQRHRALVGTRESKLAVGSCARQRIDYLVVIHGVGVRLGYRDVCPVDGWRDILRHVAGYGDSGRRAFVAHGDAVVRHLCIVDGHRVNLAEGKRLAHDGHSRSVVVGHLARLCGGEEIGHTAHLYVQRLCSGRYRQHDGCQKYNYLFHLMVVL